MIDMRRKYVAAIAASASSRCRLIRGYGCRRCGWNSQSAEKPVPSNMEFSFDIHGYLKPYGKIPTDLESFEAGFVEPFEADSTRHQLFQGYVRSYS
jgi:hypothetical protein